MLGYDGAFGDALGAGGGDIVEPDHVEHGRAHIARPGRALEEAEHGDRAPLVRTLRKIYGTTFAAGQPETAKLSDVLQQLNDTSLGQLIHDHKNGHLEKRIRGAEK